MLPELIESRLEVLQHEFFGIPVHSTCFTHPLDTRLHCVESAVRFTRGGHEEHAYFGHAARKELDAAVYGSCCEILERMLAAHSLCDGKQITGDVVGRYLFRSGQAGPYFPQQLLLREKDTEAAATGLGLHRDLARAIEHASLELVEQHVLLSMWYAEQSLVQLDRTEYLENGYRISYYTTDNRLPFVLAVLSSATQDCFFCGSSVKCRFYDAFDHARSEALQLSAKFFVKGLFSPVDGNPAFHGKVAETIARVAYLRGASAAAMHAHLASKVTAVSGAVRKADGFKEILGLAFRRLDDIHYVALGRWQDFVLVRVLTDEALTRNQMRHAYKSTGHIPDPFF
ncbi:MAG: YcaO-like family protein [Collimonas sp.]|uniref:YcaO-like family protein n=1 Tax=Collimonas sp. TaxID=1963772 RepID=UPI0032673C4F